MDAGKGGGPGARPHPGPAPGEGGGDPHPGPRGWLRGVPAWPCPGTPLPAARDWGNRRLPQEVSGTLAVPLSAGRTPPRESWRGGEPSARPPGGQQVPLQWRPGGPCPPHPTPSPSPSNFLRPSGQAEVLGAGEGRPWRGCGAETGRDGESPRGLKQGPKEVGRGRELESWTDWVGGAGRPRNFGVCGAASTGGGGALIRESPGRGPNLGSRKQAGQGLLVTAGGPETRTVRSA